MVGNLGQPIGLHNLNTYMACIHAVDQHHQHTSLTPHHFTSRYCPLTSPPSYLSTSCPTYSRSRARVSPMMVERRCPTCISLAMLGEEKSMTTRFLSTTGGLTPFTRMSVTSWDTKSGQRKMFTKPGPATSQRSIASEEGRLASIDSATLGGGSV